MQGCGAWTIVCAGGEREREMMMMMVWTERMNEEHGGTTCVACSTTFSNVRVAVSFKMKRIVRALNLCITPLRRPELPKAVHRFVLCNDFESMGNTEHNVHLDIPVSR
jgi:hypothetical protein